MKKKILIGTHNQGKFREIAFLISKKYEKISPKSLNIKSPLETGKTFYSNSRLKVRYFSKLVNFPVISDDSGICIKSLDNQPGVYSARFAKKHGGFHKAMRYILRKLVKKNNRDAKFVCSLSYKYPNGKITHSRRNNIWNYFKKNIRKKRFLDLIQYLYQFSKKNFWSNVKRKKN